MVHQAACLELFDTVAPCACECVCFAPFPPLCFIASKEGHVGVVEALLESPLLKLNDRTNGATPLAIAAHQGHGEIIGLLLDVSC